MGRPLKKAGLSQEQIQKNVDAVLMKWRDYPNFANFLGALMGANDNMTERALAPMVSKNTTHTYSSSLIHYYRAGLSEPSYSFIEDLLASNALNCRPITIEGETLDPRIIFFTKANLLEVKPQSIQKFNSEVMVNVQKQLAAKQESHWADIMHKLVDFHTQGGRLSFDDIHQTLRGAMPKDDKGEKEKIDYGQRLANILNKRVRPTADERTALYGYLALQSAHTAILEGDGINRVIRPKHETDFSKTLKNILELLKGGGYNTVKLTECPHNIVEGKIQITQSMLSHWRHGKGNPDLCSVRALIALFQPFFIPGGLLAQHDIDDLMRHSGFSKKQLTQTAHTVIAEADEQTAIIGTLLGDIRNAVDIDVTLNVIAAKVPDGSQQPLKHGQIMSWENNNSIPPVEPLQELMRRYNHVLQQKGHEPLNYDDITKVLRIADHCRMRHQELLAEEKKGKYIPKHGWRQMISADMRPSEQRTER